MDITKFASVGIIILCLHINRTIYVSPQPYQSILSSVYAFASLSIIPYIWATRYLFLWTIHIFFLSGFGLLSPYFLWSLLYIKKISSLSIICCRYFLPIVHLSFDFADNFFPMQKFHVVNLPTFNFITSEFWFINRKVLPHQSYKKIHWYYLLEHK